MQSTSETGAPVERLAAAAEDLEAAEASVAEFGEAELERLREAHEGFTDLLDRYEEPATGDGDFQEFIEFQGTVETFVERLPSDLLLREVFADCDEYLQQRRLSESDFAHVRDQLGPVADLAGRLEERDAALEAYRDARNALTRRHRELRDRIEDLERLRELGEADLDAPTDRLRDPIEAYNDAVREAFATFRAEAPARELLGLAETARAFPLVEFREPPPDLLDFLATHEVGTEPVPTLLEYADYSRSKLGHYVDDPDALKRSVATQETYLRRLDADPLTVAWPPPTAAGLRFRTRAYRAVVNRFAPDVVATLRTVERLPRRTDYSRLRAAAVAEHELSADERRRLRDGEVEPELTAAREERERVAAALAEYPDR